MNEKKKKEQNAREKERNLPGTCEIKDRKRKQEKEENDLKMQ